MSQDVPSITIFADGRVTVQGEWPGGNVGILAAVHREYLWQEEAFRISVRRQLEQQKQENALP